MKVLLLLITLGFGCNAFSAMTIECKLDAEEWIICDGQVTYENLSEGVHTFTIRATDSAGNVSFQDYTWTIDTSGPTITIIKKPSDLSNATSAEFIFEVTDAGDDLACGGIGLSWDRPIARVDGTVLDPSEIGGYKISWGLTSKGYTNSIIAKGDSVSYDVRAIGNGANFFVIQTIDTDDLYSAYSDEISVEVNC
jgi:hypothetical protein